MKLSRVLSLNLKHLEIKKTVVHVRAVSMIAEASITGLNNDHIIAQFRPRVLTPRFPKRKVEAPREFGPVKISDEDARNLGLDVPLTRNVKGSSSINQGK